jgi:hypothetical protein
MNTFIIILSVILLDNLVVFRAFGHSTVASLASLTDISAYDSYFLNFPFENPTEDPIGSQTTTNSYMPTINSAFSALESIECPYVSPIQRTSNRVTHFLKDFPNLSIVNNSIAKIKNDYTAVQNFASGAAQSVQHTIQSLTSQLQVEKQAIQVAENAALAAKTEVEQAFQDARHTYNQVSTAVRLAQQKAAQQLSSFETSAQQTIESLNIQLHLEKQAHDVAQNALSIAYQEYFATEYYWNQRISQARESQARDILNNLSGKR